MRFFFIVQGEGRGHMTQAMALSAMLRKHSHEVVRVVVGRSTRRTIPDFFLEGIVAPLAQVDSPNFVTDKESKSVSLVRSIIGGLASLGKYHKSINTIDRMVREDQPDVIVNFYDFIGGLYNMLKSPDLKFICIAHQYLAGHSFFEFAKGGLLDKFSFRLGNWLTSYRADKRLALSFQELPDDNMVIVPPLLRKEVRNLEPTKENHLLIYLLNHGYAEEVDQFHLECPEVALHCFWDNPEAPTEMKIDDTLTYHRLDGEKFLQFLASSSGYVTTAGFESVCEAMYLGKAVMMVPVNGHYEQACNAIDATRAGAGIWAQSFDLKRFLDYLHGHNSDDKKFNEWCEQAEKIFLENLA